MKKKYPYLDEVLEPLEALLLSHLNEEEIRSLPLYFKEEGPYLVDPLKDISEQICFGAALELGELGLFVLRTILDGKERS